MHGATWDVGGSGLHGALCPTRHTAHDSDYQGLRPPHAHASPVPRPDGSVPQRPSDASKLLHSGAACHETKGQHGSERDTAPISVDRGRVVPAYRDPKPYSSVSSPGP